MPATGPRRTAAIRQAIRIKRARPANSKVCRGWRQLHCAKGVIIAITSDQLYFFADIAIGVLRGNGLLSCKQGYG